jgi:hypothetical protein
MKQVLPLESMETTKSGRTSDAAVSGSAGVSPAVVGVPPNTLSFLLSKTKQNLILLWLLAGTIATTLHAVAQTSQQILTFSIQAQFATNHFSTNRATGIVTTNTTLDTALISTPTIIRDIALDLYGPAYTNWKTATLLRETDAQGHEGIFLHKSAPLTNVNVSRFFSISYTNDFASQVAANYNPITNFNNIPDLSSNPNYYDFPPGPAFNWPNITNFVFNVTNPVEGGLVRIEKNTSKATNAFLTTNYGVFPPSSVNLCYVSLNTVNLQFSLLASGTTVTTNLGGYLPRNPIVYTNQVQTTSINFAIGTYRANLTTNILAPTLLDFVSGPAHVYLPFGTSPPSFSTNLASEVFP